MTIPVLRRRSRRSDHVIGHLVRVDGAWSFEEKARHPQPAGLYPTADAAESALRAAADQHQGERILAAGFVAALGLHPVLYTLTALA